MKDMIAKILLFLRYNLLGNGFNNFFRNNFEEQWFLMRNYLKRWQDIGHVSTSPYQSAQDAIMANHLASMLKIKTFDAENQDKWAKNFLCLLK